MTKSDRTSAAQWFRTPRVQILGAVLGIVLTAMAIDLGDYRWALLSAGSTALMLWSAYDERGEW